MRRIFLGIWLFVRFIIKCLQLVVGTVFFLAAAAEIVSLALNHGSIIQENFRNLAARFAHFDVPQRPDDIQTPKAPRSRNCLHFEKKLIDLHCEEKSNPADKLLCKITVPPTELVCVEYESQIPTHVPRHALVESFPSGAPGSGMVQGST